MRTGARDGYSRVTLGWTEKVTYSLDETGDGVLIIKFDRSAKIDTTQADFSVLDNVSAIKVVSTDPLTLSLNVPESSKVRGFKIGKRIILDIYDPSDPKEAKSFKNPPSEKMDKDDPKIGKTVAKKPAPKEDSPSHEVKNHEVKKLAATPPAFVLVPENLPEKPALDKEHKNANKKLENKHAAPVRNTAPSPAAQKKLANAVQEEHHVISLRATKSIDMAVFENHGELWLVMGGLSSYVIPGLNSATPEIFSHFQPMSLEDGMAYHMTMPKTPLRIKAKGGGLIWDIIMGPKVKEAESIKPVHRTENSPDFHGEKIFWPLEAVRNIVDLADPITGKTLKVVLVEDSTQFTGALSSYVD